MGRVAATWMSCVLLAAPCAAQPAASQAAPSHAERLADLLGVIEGQNSPEVRRTVARELLLQGWPETPARIVAILCGSNGPAKAAVAGALSELPAHLVPAYIEPLMAMLSDSDADVRAAAAAALAAYQNGGVTPRLRTIALDAGQPPEPRLAAIRALGLMTRREAVDSLAEALTDPDPAIAGAALRALEQATAMDFGGDVASARRWWDETRSLSREDWQQSQIERLVRKDRETRRRLEEVEGRLVRVLETSFLRAPDGERAAMLAGFVADSSTAIRLLGLRLTQVHLAEGKALPADLPEDFLKQVRSLIASPDPRIQAAAIRTVASLRDPADGERFLTLLAESRRREVVQALINGLGYIGGPDAVAPLLDHLHQPDESIVTEAVAALGRLAERGVLAEDSREHVAERLLEVFERTSPNQVALRERTLWAMGIVADRRFGPALAAALAPTEAVAVRQAAARGLAALNDPAFADALIAAAQDPDPAVRKTATVTLVALGAGERDRNLDALWRRLSPKEEADETIRQAAAQGVLGLLARRPADQLEVRLARLPANGSDQGARMLEFLRQLAKRVQEADATARDRLGVVETRTAALLVELGRPAEAVDAYLAALADLQAAGAATAPRVALDLLRAALAAGRYDQSIASAITTSAPAPGPDEIWQAIVAEVEPRLTPEGADQALAMLSAIAEHPPGVLPADALQELRTRAQRLKQPPSAGALVPATQAAAAGTGEAG